MAHILKNPRAFAIGCPYFAVRVMVKGDKLIVEPGSIAMVKPDTMIAELPKRYKVVTMEGEVLEPSMNFYITTDTINPYHLLLDK